MLKVMQTGRTVSGPKPQIPEDGWIHGIEPTQDELKVLHAIGIPDDLLTHIYDMDERSRVEHKDGVTYLVIRYPWQQKPSDRIPFITVPLNIFILPGSFVTIEPQRLGLESKLKEVLPTSIPREIKTNVVLDLLLLTASEYLAALDTINHSVEEAEAKLVRSLRNQEVLLLLNNQKSLVYFTTALNMIQALLQKLSKDEFLSWNNETREGVEDALIEIRQAVNQVEIAQDILTQMMDSFASIVSNNLNTVMKFLTAITIIVSVPTLIASIYGMNVPLPGSTSPTMFWWLLLASGAICFAVAVIFNKMDWL
ncbi:MAG: magnesium transporter CorA family protein [Anaerolineales bacterium]|jgi:magnesium transporter